MSDTPEKYLVVGPAWVGDMVMAQSLYKLIWQRHPLSIIDVTAPAWTEPLLARMPEVRRAIPLPLTHGQLEIGKRWKLGRSLLGEHYDHAIVLPRSWKSAIVPFAAGARRRTGYLGEVRWGLLNDVRKLDRLKLPRTVDRFNALALTPDEAPPAEPPLPRLMIDPDNARAALQRYTGSVTLDVPVLGLCPGAEYGPAKRWPVSHFVEVARNYLDNGGQVWLFGSGKDTEATTAINAACDNRCLDLGGRTSLADAIDMMSLTTAVVSNDSGLMHVAAALDKPVVAVYGSSDPGFTPPLTPKAKILRLGLDCSPCFRRECPLGHTRCLVDLKPAQVMAALK